MAETPHRLTLSSSSASPGDARRWVASELGGWEEELIDAAKLLVTELVTNAVLYAASDIDVVVDQRDHAVRVEVADHSTKLPVMKDYGVAATTGRGLGLLESLAWRWGVDPSDDGKVIWFDLVPAHADRPRPTEGSGDGAPSTSAPAVDADGGAPHPGMREILLCGAPLDLIRQSNAHGDALGREFRLILEQGNLDPKSVPVRLALFVVRTSPRFAEFNGPPPGEVAAAAERGDATMDLRVTVPLDVAPMVTRFLVLLDDADAFCREGSLLTLAAPAPVRAVRRWFFGQFVDQLAGEAPVSWSESPEARALADGPDQIDRW